MPEDTSRHGPIYWMIHHGVASNLLMLFFLGFGLFTLFNITQEFFPNIERDTVTVRVPYPGASPEEVEQGIILVVEEAIRQLEGIKEITSVASEGSGSVTAELLDTVDNNKLLQDIKSEVDRITTFPEDAEEPIVMLDSRRRMVLSVIVWGDTTETALRELAEMVRERLLRHPKITQVDVIGTRKLEIAIEVPRENLRRYGLTMAEIASRLRQASVELPSGAIETKSGEILVRLQERRDWGRQFATTPIITNPDGTQVLLEDIATVIDGFEDTDQAARFNGKRAVMLEVYRVGDQTPTEVQKATEEMLEQMQNDLPAGTHAKIRFSLAKIYGQRAQLLLKNGASGLCVVLLLLGSFLELRLAFWVMMGVPVSFLGAILLMPMVGMSINMMTMFAFIVALGIVVDDAIVVGENIYHHYQEGEDLLAAAVSGTREVASPIAFSILTNIVAFIPLMFLPGIMGKILWMLPMVVILAFIISWIECLFILPTHLAHGSDRRLFPSLHKNQQKFSNAFRNWVRTKYAPFLEKALVNRYMVLMVALAILSLTLAYWKSGRMGFQQFATVESDYAYGTCLMPYGTPVEKTTEVVDRMEAAAVRAAKDLKHPELIDGIFTEIGRGGSHTANLRIYLPPADVRERLKISTQRFIDVWRKQIGHVPGVTLIRLQADRGGPGSRHRGLTLELRHENVDVLEQAAKDVVKDLDKYPLVSDTDTGFQEGKPQIDFRVTDAGKSVGLTAREISRQLRNSYEGAEVLRQQRGRDEIKVRVRLPEEERSSEYDLDDFVLQIPGGGEIPLSEAAVATRGHAYTSIHRRNAKRTMTVSADIRPKSKAGQVRRSLNADVMPRILSRYPGLEYSYEGREAENRESFDRLWLSIPLVLVAIYGLLAIPFRSYAQPLVVMVAIPFGVVGAVAGHLIMGYEMTMFGVIGMVALSGVVVNDALILIDFANRRRTGGVSAHDAITSAGVQRFRPILLTTLTTFGGLMPMIFETSRQARFLIPMAISLGYGLLFATMINLLLVPCLYMILNDISPRFRRSRHPSLGFEDEPAC